MTTSRFTQSHIAQKYAALNQYFMPEWSQGDGEVIKQLQMFLGSHFLGPILGLSVPLSFYFFDPTPGWELIVLAASILSFWLFPFLLKAGVAYDRLVLMSIGVDWFVVFWACYFYGGEKSPTVVWFLIIPILAVFYIGGDGRQRKGLLVISYIACLIFAVAYWGFAPEPNDIPQYAMEFLSLISAIAVMCYIAGMAVYYSRVFDAGVELENEVARRKFMAVELQHAVDSATKAASAKSEFLARMSHELRSPLNAIIGYGELLKEDGLDDPDPVMNNDIDRILDAGRYLTCLIDMILDLAKIESGKMKFDICENNIGEIITRAAERYRTDIEKRGNALSIHIPADLETGLVDANRLDQVADSIISNAVAYTENGEIDITVLRVEMDCGIHLEVSVVDTGVGIDKDALPTIFESFVTDRDAAQGRFGGTGLALSVCSKLCEAMGGTISVKSSIGEGSTFTFRLPLQPVSSDTCEDLENSPGGTVAAIDRTTPHLGISDLTIAE